MPGHLSCLSPRTPRSARPGSPQVLEPGHKAPRAPGPLRRVVWGELRAEHTGASQGRGSRQSPRAARHSSGPGRRRCPGLSPAGLGRRSQLHCCGDASPVPLPQGRGEGGEKASLQGAVVATPCGSCITFGRKSPLTGVTCKTARGLFCESHVKSAGSFQEAAVTSAPY